MAEHIRAFFRAARAIVESTGADLNSDTPRVVSRPASNGAPDA